MLPGQPVSLLGSCRDEHSPGVGVNMLGQHVLVQESEGNHQSPEQQQRAGPQIHQSIGVPQAGEQEGPGSRRVLGAGGPAASQRQHSEAHRPLCPTGPSSAQAHMEPSPQNTGTDRPGQKHDLQRDRTVVRPRAPLLRPRESRLHHVDMWVSHWARGPWHRAPAAPRHTDSQGADTPTPPALMVCPHVCCCMEMLFTLPITQCLLINTGNQPGGEEGTKGGTGEARQGPLFLLLPLPLLQLGWDYLGTEVGAPQEVSLPLQS